MTPRMTRHAGGVALVTAIFLLVVLAGLSVAIVSLTTAQQSAATQDEQGARAYQAARAGMEWALYVSLRSAGGLAANPLGCDGTVHTMVMPAPTLAAFTVTVNCIGAPSPGYGAAAPDPTAGGVRIRATACNQPAGGVCPNPAPGPDYVQRVVEAQL